MITTILNNLLIIELVSKQDTEKNISVDIKFRTKVSKVIITALGVGITIMFVKCGVDPEIIKTIISTF